MNIGFITSTYHPLIGGAETYALSLIQGLRARKHRVLVLTDDVTPGQSPEVWPDVFRARQYNSALKDPDKVRWEQMYFSILQDAEHAFGSSKLDIVHANSQDAAIIGSMVAQALKVPLVCTMHEQAPEAEALGDGRCGLIYQYLPIDMIIAGSEFYYKRAIRYGTSPDRVQLIYHGVDTDLFCLSERGSTVRQRLGLADSDFLIVSAGRLKQRKGMLELVQAFALAKRKVENLKLLIAGSCNSASREYADLLYHEINECRIIARC